MGKLEIPYESLTEYVVNALVHRSLNIKSPIRIFIFDNRVEIHSPGTLPNGLTVEDVKNGTSMPRNMFLFTNANYLLPYTGAGSGVRRALEYNPNAVFSNGVEDKEITHAANEFVITIPRESNQAQAESNQVMTANERKSNQADKGSNQPCVNLVTRKLTKKEEDIRNFCSVPRTAQEIMDRLKISNQSKNRQKYITSLIELEVLERTIPEKPNDPNQKYRRKK
ncbi:ATP-binding protein [Bacteroides sp.]|uniref:ATP-binding protein n=1 Tax=Bacteroides sp. TaxID=29523 RepID=UPI00344FCFB5